MDCLLASCDVVAPVHRPRGVRVITRSEKVPLPATPRHSSAGVPGHVVPFLLASAAIGRLGHAHPEPASPPAACTADAGMASWRHAPADPRPNVVPGPDACRACSERRLAGDDVFPWP